MLALKAACKLQARFLLAKLNPSATHQTEQGAISEIIFTEDVSLEVRPHSTLGYPACDFLPANYFAEFDVEVTEWGCMKSSSI